MACAAAAAAADSGEELDEDALEQLVDDDDDDEKKEALEEQELEEDIVGELSSSQLEVEVVAESLDRIRRCIFALVLANAFILSISSLSDHVDDCCCCSSWK